MGVDTLFTWGVTVSACVWFGFLVSYSRHAKWWRNPVGRNAFGVSLVLFLILARVAVVQWFPEAQQREWVAVIVYGLLPTIYGIQRWRQMRKAQKDYVVKMIQEGKHIG
jgi:hypothetical protein